MLSDGDSDDEDYRAALRESLSAMPPGVDVLAEHDEARAWAQNEAAGSSRSAGAGPSAAGARPRDDRRLAPAPANALQPLSMCWPMTDKATVASHIGQRAHPSSSPPLRGAGLRGVSSMWNDLSGRWLDALWVFAGSGG